MSMQYSYYYFAEVVPLSSIVKLLNLFTRNYFAICILNYNSISDYNNVSTDIQND